MHFCQCYLVLLANETKSTKRPFKTNYVNWKFMEDISPGLGSSPLTAGVKLLQLFEVQRGRHSTADT